VNRFWKWLGENSNQLGALAALVAIVATVAVLPIWIGRKLSPEVEVVVRQQAAVMPEDLEAWTSSLAFELVTLPNPSEGEADRFERFRELAITGPLSLPPETALRSDSVYSPELLEIEVSNHADRTIPGVRLRVDNTALTWGVTLSAEFLTSAEIRTWEAQVSDESRSDTLVLPELPPLPPESTVSIVGFGRARNARVSGTVPNASIGIIEIIEVEDRGLIAFVRQPPLWFPLLLGGTLALLTLLGGLFLRWFNHLVYDRTRRDTTYNLACSEALAGRTDSSLALLREALDVGFSDDSLLRTDQDLDSIRDTTEFKVLYARLQGESSPTD